LHFDFCILNLANISQKAVKHDFIGPLDRNQRKTYEVLTAFYAKQTQFAKSQMNVSIFSQKAYENKSNWTLGENKPNSNPNKANLNKNECKLLCSGALN